MIGTDGKVSGVITDHDICVALATRNKLAGEITVGEVSPNSKLFACSPEEEIHPALLTMRDAKVRHLPVIDADGQAVGVLSMDDVLLHADPNASGKIVELSTDDAVRCYRAINQRELPQVVKRQTVAA